MGTERTSGRVYATATPGPGRPRQPAFARQRGSSISTCSGDSIRSGRITASAGPDHPAGQGGELAEDGQQARPPQDVGFSHPGEAGKPMENVSRTESARRDERTPVSGPEGPEGRVSPDRP